MNTDIQPPLFHRAIIESGAATSRAVHPYNARLHEQQFKEFIQVAGCADHTKTEIMTCLRTQPSETITNASFTVFDRYNPSVRWAFQPVIDGDLIKQRPIDAWHSGKWNQMPILTGFNTNEGSYYVPVSMSTSEQFTDFFRTLLPAYTEEDIQTINRLYPDPALDPSSAYAETRNIPVGSQFKRVEAAYAHYAYAHRPVWEAYDSSRESEKRIMIIGKGNDERAGGGGRGIAAQIAQDEWSRRECEFWWTKSGISD